MERIFKDLLMFFTYDTLHSNMRDCSLSTVLIDKAFVHQLF